MNHPSNTIMVTGDAFTDRWITVKRRGPSAEVGGLSIYDELSQVDQPGGAANVQHALRRLLPNHRVPLLASRPYTVKRRYVEVGDPYRPHANGRQVFRVDEPNKIRPISIDSPWEHYLHIAEDVVVSDYGKGSINEEVLQTIISSARNRVWINAKLLQPYHGCADMAGDAARLRAPWIAWTCNEYEYTAAAAFYDRQAHVYVTSKAGITHYQYGQATNKAASKARKVVSVCGAGDVVLAALVASRGSLSTAMHAAAVSVEHPGTYCPTAEEVEEHINACD